MLYESIKYLFPNAVAGINFSLRDDGEGPYIEQWSLAEPQPTADALVAASKIVESKRLCASIDAMADKARQDVAGDPLRAMEYETAAAEALVFKSAGYPSSAVPRTVAAWAISGRSAQQAADDILGEAAAYSEALYRIREARLSAKEQVRQAVAANQIEQARSIATATIAGIQAAIVGTGNAGA